ncbi:MAG: hypothetical protein IKQ97_04580 [Eubacterium sp.]|nr:hypothetical protein [Eubacterium sp.]
MKMQYKKLVIIISVATLLLGFFILTLIPNGKGGNDVTDVELLVNENPEINNLIAEYFTAKKTVDMEAFGSIVSDVNQIDRTKFTAMAAYVEDYQNINCYVIENTEGNGYRVYAKYDMKLKNIETLAPSLTAFYVTTTADGKYIIYLSALDEVQESFIEKADENEGFQQIVKDVQASLDEAIDSDPTFRQLYQRMDKEIKAAPEVSPENGEESENPDESQAPVDSAEPEATDNAESESDS